LAQDDPQTYNFDYFGIAFDVTTEGEVELNESRSLFTRHQNRLFLQL
jgi:hypothetical protein